MNQQKLYWLHKFRTTKYYFHFSLLQLLLTVLLLSCVTLQYQKVVFQLQVTIAILLLIDISVRYLTDKDNFFKKVINDIDIAIAFLILSFLAIQVFTNFDISFILGELQSIVIDIRYGLQIYRIYALFKQAKQNRQVNNYQDVHIEINNQVDLNDDIMSQFVSSKTTPKAL